ncbi:hypothetical protein D3C76_1000240 [compost metagenome]
MNCSVGQVCQRQPFPQPGCGRMHALDPRPPGGEWPCRCDGGDRSAGDLHAQARVPDASHLVPRSRRARCPGRPAGGGRRDARPGAPGAGRADGQGRFGAPDPGSCRRRLRQVDAVAAVPRALPHPRPADGMAGAGQRRQRPVALSFPPRWAVADAGWRGGRQRIPGRRARVGLHVAGVHRRPAAAADHPAGRFRSAAEPFGDQLRPAGAGRAAAGGMPGDRLAHRAGTRARPAAGAWTAARGEPQCVALQPGGDRRFPARPPSARPGRR